MDGAALVLEPLAWTGDTRPVTPPSKGDVQRELGELASTVAANIAAQRDAHDRLRTSLDANEAKLNAIGETLATLKGDFKAWKDTPPEAVKLRFTAAVTYSIVTTALLLGGVAANLYQAQQTSIHDLAMKIETKEKVDAAEQRLKDFKEAKFAADADRVEKLSQLNAAYITSLQRDQKR